MTNNILLFIILSLSVVGGIGIGIVSRKKGKDERRKIWTKYIVYLLIIYTLFAAILYVPVLFRVLCVLVVLGGGIELTVLQRSGKRIPAGWFCLFVLLYLVMSILFCFFGYETQDILLFTLLIVCSFDAFSQLSGQLFGQRKICPNISPNKTLEGTIGGTVISLVVSIVVGQGMDWGIAYSSLLGLGIAASSFVGDLSASYVKRQYGVKDFSRIFPGHGGFLDRFDSLICAGAFVFLFQIIYAQV